ncbi:MAG: thiamine pyrophosphate-dependent dehydrogenase E1 component subunit alpha [Chloroflexi bacterium]|jgi:TPP-dependent pyruvate/acetoin dehydrogenase alpha subunit|nr:thiamine pyrophosphate-dependent dehydrogenase E1 component subunit alpha [Anaerolineaceae bacterium]NMB88012.1 thiamine pyrophosphate-dependent dehydrogenase E1 component subunit alpha [Chloroflexota bacterium]
MISKQELLKMYAQMVLGRLYMEKIVAFVKMGKLVGFFHLGLGQEAISAGILNAIGPDDYIVPTHRQQTLLVNLLDTDKFTCELIGRANGYCKGLGFEFHISNPEKHLFPISAVLGSSAPMGVGAAMALKLDGRHGAVICCFGEGASNEGNVHEAMNIASTYKLPVVFMIENNGWAISQPAERGSAVADIASRAAGYNMPGVVVDGTDACAVAEALQKAVAAARDCQPNVIEMKVVRWRGHFEGDPQVYRDLSEVDVARQNDCILKLDAVLVESYGVTREELDDVRTQAAGKVDAAFAYAESSPVPTAEEILNPEFVYATPSGGLAL